MSTIKQTDSVLLSRDLSFTELELKWPPSVLNNGGEHNAV